MNSSSGAETGSRPLVGDLESVLGVAFPREWAEDWDRVGLLAGDRNRDITGVLVTLDPTRSAITRAQTLGANVLLTHHPAALTMPERLAAGRGPAGTVFAALDAGVALIAEHTNLDRAPQGVAALPTRLGLRQLGPVERSVQPMTRITVYAPAESAHRLIDAMSKAGAGQIGAYERCAFSGPGVGEFTASAGSRPYAGQPGEPSRVKELRIEMLCARPSAVGVIAAARAVHPYEEPLIVSEPVSIARSAARMGMLCEPEGAPTLEELSVLCSRTLNVRPRVWGERSARIRRCVTATGSAGSLIGDVLAAGADALVCGEVRYHDALDAAESGLAIVEAGHDVTEWPLVELLGAAALGVRGLPADNVMIETPTAGWWTP